MIAVETRLTCCGKYPPDDAAQPHQELPQRHVLLADRHHQRAGIVLHEDARHAVTARGVVYHPLLENRWPEGEFPCQQMPVKCCAVLIWLCSPAQSQKIGVCLQISCMCSGGLELL